jgi:hypothetical protein
MWDLLEIGVSSRIYTWRINQENLVMCKLDRIFFTTSFDAKFPLAGARALSRSGSNHTQLVWDYGEAKVPKKGCFKFEKWWVAIPKLRELVIKDWALEVNSNNIVDVWQEKVRMFRRLAKG